MIWTEPLGSLSAVETTAPVTATGSAGTGLFCGSTTTTVHAVLMGCMPPSPPVPPSLPAPPSPPVPPSPPAAPVAVLPAPPLPPCPPVAMTPPALLDVEAPAGLPPAPPAPPWVRSALKAGPHAAAPSRTDTSTIEREASKRTMKHLISFAGQSPPVAAGGSIITGENPTPAARRARRLLQPEGGERRRSDHMQELASAKLSVLHALPSPPVRVASLS